MNFILVLVPLVGLIHCKHSSHLSLAKTSLQLLLDELIWVGTAMLYPCAVSLAVILCRSPVAPCWAPVLPHAGRTCLLFRMSQCKRSLRANETVCVLLSAPRVLHGLGKIKGTLLMQLR